MRNDRENKKWVGTIVVGAICVALVAAAFPAVTAASDNNVGRHAYKVNVIGRPNDWNGDDTGSSSNTLFISLDSYEGTGSICEESSGVTDDTSGQTAIFTEPTAGQRITFTVGDFQVLDRDATDGRAIIQVPATTGNGGYDVYIRTLGKPGGCLDADGYAQEEICVDGVCSSQWWFSGHLDANRKTGAPTKVNINDMFDVWVDTNGDGYADTELSVFDERFVEYFWQVQNDGLRNMQIIFYETA